MQRYEVPVEPGTCFDAVPGSSAVGSILTDVGWGVVFQSGEGVGSVCVWCVDGAMSLRQDAELDVC